MARNAEAMEHRVGTRVNLHTQAELRVSGAVRAAVVRNASLTGAFLESATSLPLLSRVELRPVDTEEQWLEACVIRVEEDGMGLEWLDAGVHTVQALLCANRTTRDHPELSAPASSAQDDALARARSEVASGEFDLQG